MSPVMGEVKLNSQPGKWFYLEGQNPCTYTNVHLISSDGFFYRFNAAMLAASSLFMRQVLAEAWPKDSLVSADDATVVIQTEIPKSQLAVVHSFVCRGVLSGTLNIDTLTTETFATFGIRLQDLTFEKVAVKDCSATDIAQEVRKAGGFSCDLQTKDALPDASGRLRGLRKRGRKVVYEEPDLLADFKAEPLVKIKEEDGSYFDHGATNIIPGISLSQVQSKHYDDSYYSDGNEVKDDEEYEDGVFVEDHDLDAGSDLEDEDQAISNAYRKRRKGEERDPKSLSGRNKKRRRLSDSKKAEIEERKKVPLEERTCICCGKAFQNRNKLARHYKSTRISESHTDTCPHCPDVVFKSWFEHRDHVNSVHGGKFTFRCMLDDCQETFETTGERNAHRRTFHMLRQSHYFYFPQSGQRDLSKKYQCGKCVRGFKSKSTYDQHILRHEAQEAGSSGIFACSLCPDDEALKYNSIADLEAHKKAAHSGMTLNCHICNKRFTKKGQLVNHIKRHENPTPKPLPEPVEVVSCICCGKEVKKSKLNDHLKCRGPYHNDKCAYPTCNGLTFESFVQHRNHVEKVHEGVFLSRCKHCPETFLNNVLRKQHIKKFHPVDSNTEGKEWVCCEACGKSVRKCYMANHMTQWHSEKNVQCSQCSEMFTSNTSLKRHVLLKHSEITCQLCGKVFPELNYKRHVWSVHTPEDQKPYLCTICTPVRGFHYKRSLDDHMNVHTGEKPNRCKTCNASYASRANLSAHIRSVHKGIKRVK